ncbi:MAG TPA: cytochrome c3 family protein [Myxococcota bacterium]|nr:cytochrome c3 family protein [Myxococcota bacterium]
MSRRAKIFGSLVMAAMFLGAVALAADAPASVDLSRYKSSKPVSAFDHKAHVDAKIECKECHHAAKDGNFNVKCDTCHQKKAEGKAPGIKDAFHKNCKGCHEKAKNPKAPTKCNGCHKA